PPATAAVSATSTAAGRTAPSPAPSAKPNVPDPATTRKDRLGNPTRESQFGFRPPSSLPHDNFPREAKHAIIDYATSAHKASERLPVAVPARRARPPRFGQHGIRQSAPDHRVHTA